MMGGHGKDKLVNFAEIVAATVPCRDLSLSSAVAAEEWFEAHDVFGRNHP